MAKLRSRKTLRSTSGFSIFSSRIRNAIAMAKTSAVQRTHCAPNQSTSWPLSRIPAGSQGDAQQTETDRVHAPRFGVPDIRRIEDEARKHKDGEHADGDVDVEGPAPRVLIGEPTAEGGAEHRRDDHAEAEHRHGQAAFLRRKTFEQNGLRQAAAKRPPPAPCTARATRIMPRLVAAPHINEESVKIRMQASRNRFRPKRSANQPLAGSTSALATR